MTLVGLCQMALMSPVASPKGSVLGPILFLLYINVIPNLFKDYNVACKLFADDVKLCCLPLSPTPSCNLLSTRWSNGMAHGGCKLQPTNVRSSLRQDT